MKRKVEKHFNIRIHKNINPKLETLCEVYLKPLLRHSTPTKSAAFYPKSQQPLMLGSNIPLDARINFTIYANPIFLKKINIGNTHRVTSDREKYLPDTIKIQTSISSTALNTYISFIYMFINI